MTTEPKTAGPRDQVRRALWTGIALGLATLLACLAQPIFEFVHTVEANKVLRSVHSVDLMRGRLMVDIFVFALGLILVHVALGLLAAGGGLASCFAFKRLRATPAAQVTILWYAAIMGWIFAANSAWFPWSNAGAFYAEFFADDLLGYSKVDLYSAVLIFAGAFVLASLGVRLAADRQAPRLVGTALSLAITVTLAAGVSGSTSVNAAGSSSRTKPNVVIIGIDSLRLEQLAAFGGGGVTPNIDRIVGSSFLFKDTVTPIARTFPSWVSILSGRYPDRTGARINLIDRDIVDATPTLAETLRHHGYFTAFATDEVRFSNIDQSYGFDQVITPRIGAADFLLGMFNDFPVTNVLANTRVAQLLFPHTYANRAAATRYEPQTFVKMLDRELRPDGATFVAVHLTMPHWPYLWSDAPRPSKDLPKKEAELWVYRNGLAVADRQFGEVLRLLTERGVMDNAILIVLSDHGEALFQPGDRLIPKEFSDIPGAARPIEVSTFGHGASVLSPVQYQVLLAIQGVGEAATLFRSPAESQYPASLVDITPTVLDALGIESPTQVDGLDLFAVVDDGDAHSRIRFTETEFNLPTVMAGQLDPAALALQGADYYTVDEESGWLEFRPDKLKEIDSRRERAALSGRYILAALPTVEGESRFLLADRSSGAAKLVMSREDLPQPAQTLWQALHEKYGRFLGPPST